MKTKQKSKNQIVNDWSNKEVAKKLHDNGVVVMPHKHQYKEKKSTVKNFQKNLRKFL